VIAFPKNQRGIDVMFDAPSLVPTELIDDIGLQLKPTDPATGPSI
jgi:aspartyl-tRNA synthetase